MSGKNEHFENVVLILVAGGVVVGAVVYVLYLFWPYMVFYFLPFVVGSLVFGVVLKSFTGSNEEGIIDHWGLALGYPILLALVAVVFFAGSERAVELDKKGNVTATYLEWPKLDKAFNEMRYSVYADSPFKSLKEKAKQGVVYDRQEMGWIFLWSLFLGGPLFFWYLSRRDLEKNQSVMKSIVNERIKAEQLRIDRKHNELNQIIENNAHALKSKIADLERVRAALLSENLRLKATVEFSSDIVKPSETSKSRGVLDSDIL